jgi:hypothetical protein
MYCILSLFQSHNPIFACAFNNPNFQRLMSYRLFAGGRINTLILPVLFLMIPYRSTCSEFVVIDRLITWSEEAQSAFYMFLPDNSMPSNWLYPDDYFNGMIYTRYEILSVATDEPCGMQFGIFQWKDANRTVCGELCENIRWLSGGAGSVAENGSSPSTWWESFGGVDFSKIYDLQSLSPTIWCNNPRSPIAKPGQGGDDAGVAWSRRFNWFPVTIRVTVIAVSAGSVFSGWDDYMANHPTKQPVPDFKIDYIHETTNKIVTHREEYSMQPDMSDAKSGDGKKLKIIPGQTVYFRTRAEGKYQASDIQILRVLSRPVAPAFTINMENHCTATGIPETCEYSFQPFMHEASTGDGAAIYIPPGTSLYIRKKATAVSFCSFTQALNERPASVIYEFILYPNPVSDGTLFVQTTIPPPCSVEILSPEGRLMKQFTLDESSDWKIDLTGLNKGLYICRTIKNDCIYNRKIIIE